MDRLFFSEPSCGPACEVSADARLEAAESREDVGGSSSGAAAVLSFPEAMPLSSLKLGEAVGEDEVGNLRCSVGP